MTTGCSMSERIDTSGDDHSVASWIWRNLVPRSGQSGTVQGELLRAVEKLRWEAQNNGNINWDDGFVILIDYLRTTLNADASFTDADRHAVNSDLDRLRNFTAVDELAVGADDGELPYLEDDLYDRLTGFVVKFARTHPVPLARADNPALHR
jgi:hypothetical protein